MPFNLQLASRVRDYLFARPEYLVQEKKMFGGLAFLVNGKMCVNVSGEQLMCRFHPDKTSELSARDGFQTMVMRGKVLNGYGYVSQEALDLDSDFEFWMRVCLEYNPESPTSKR